MNTEQLRRDLWVSALKSALDKGRGVQFGSEDADRALAQFDKRFGVAEQAEIGQHQGCVCAGCEEIIENEADGESTPSGSMHSRCADEHKAKHPEQW